MLKGVGDGRNETVGNLNKVTTLSACLAEVLAPTNIRGTPTGEIVAEIEVRVIGALFEDKGRCLVLSLSLFQKVLFLLSSEVPVTFVFSIHETRGHLSK